ncbi:bifunctional DNA-formamidopyrimidine glycosylase/DNA-(apurinic or apyrimidinic site) lyase [Ideonella sp. 4Y11]|uniref:Formamidopyrimidine-DNA glycosylase n=1 Tax=Ideonella aquatica TaxID=2824119 RepID=A0A940YF39_9BURK|nr:bifunctional DNA-formamidopyrimidine glycosylase/DNA-(apurinic or apyrimidinic site) lyase [Ideonella aquatica]MBQ0958149.1 bifunctional DNA-formamidopyrimidine glycosylase/DNA-(apurinic or apyrimidinic site) lyase [Ideonella aquatica]
MPELPEVEVTRRSIAAVEGAQVQRLRLGKPLRWPLGRAPEDLAGCRIGPLGRRGKYLLMPLQGPEGGSAGVLLWHLGMSGSLAWLTGPHAANSAGLHDHVDLLTDQGLLRLTDPRRFGAVVWSASLQQDPAAKLLAGLGPEPFDETLTDARFLAALRTRRSPIKPALLSGELVVGAGNIYASDALFEAGIDPRTPCHRIGPRRASRLLAAVRQVLAEAIEAGGSTLKDFRDAHGSVGQYQQAVRVYGREGEACRRCGHAIRRLLQGQRATYYCPGCQRR